MSSKADLVSRVAPLGINPEAIQEIRLPDFDAKIVPSTSTVNSVQIYASITTPDGYITPQGAQTGLSIYGKELQAEAFRGDSTEEPRHINVVRLQEILSNGRPLRCDIVRKDTAKPFPFSNEEMQGIVNEFGTPFHIYDEASIRTRAREMREAFGILPNFKNFYAVKANPNPAVLRILQEEGMGADCSAGSEVDRAIRSGFRGEDIMFTSNNTSIEGFMEAYSHGAIINFDDATFPHFFEKNCGPLPSVFCVRYNPGAGRNVSESNWDTKESKYGLREDQLRDAYLYARDKGVTRFGLHTMVASNERDPQFFVETGRVLAELGVEISGATGIPIEFINIGGGISIPYRPEQKPVNERQIAQGLAAVHKEILGSRGLNPNIYMENGRCVTGQSGWLVSKVRHVMEKHKTFVGLDAPMASLFRAGIYPSAYHHIFALGKENEEHDHLYDFASGLCESVKFGKNRVLPRINVDDTVVICDTGAHAIVMGNNYNDELRPQELLRGMDGKVRRIRRADTRADLYAPYE